MNERIRAIVDAPGAGPAYYERALALLDLKRRGRAMRDLASAFEWDASLVARAKREPALAPYLRDPFIVRFTDKSSPIARAVRDLHEERFEQALPAAEALVAASPNDAPAWYVLSLAAAGLNDWKRSLEAARKALAVDPTFVDARFNEAAALEAVDDHEGAIEAYQEALRAEPDHESSAFNLVLLLRRLERHMDASAVGEAFLREVPEARMLRYKHAETLALLDRPDDALAELDKLVVIDPKARDAVPHNAHFEKYLARDEWQDFLDGPLSVR